MSTGRRLHRLRVEVGAAPSTHLLRAAIERRLAGHAFPPGPEAQVADAVAKAVAAQLAPVRLESGGSASWR